MPDFLQILMRMRSALVVGLLLYMSPAYTAPVGGAADFLEELVVTASRYEQRVFDSPASLSVLNEEALDQSTAYALADLLRDLPGVQVTDSGQPGLKRIRVRGEESRRTAILINSQEVTDHHEVGTPLTLHPAMVERVEVLRGSGAVLYGSRALSGVVNFITRKGGTQPLQFTLSGGYDSATNGYNSFASVFGNVEGLEYRLAFADSDHGDRRTPQGKIGNTSFDNSNLYLYAAKSFADHHLQFTYEDYESSSEIYVEEEVRTSFPLTDFYLDTPQRDRQRYSLRYTWEMENTWLASLEASAYHDTADRHFYTRSELVFYERDIHTVGELTTDGALLQMNFQPLGDHQLMAGVQYLDDVADQWRQVDTLSWTPGIPSGVEVIRDEAEIETWALYLQDSWSLREDLSLTMGARQYFVSGKLQASDRESLTAGKLDDDNELIGALGLVWDVAVDARLRMNVSQGYVYPSLMQLATGAYAGSRFVNPQPDLDPEKSVNYELGWRLQRDALVLDATVFYTHSDDYIHHLPCTASDQCPSSRDRLYQNVGESNAHGLELFLDYRGGPWNTVPYVNLTWMKRRNEYAEFSTWDSGVPELKGRLGLRWQGDLIAGTGMWLDAYLRGESSSQLKEPGTSRDVLEDKNNWLTLNMAGGVKYGSREQYQLALELHNLNDESYITSTENLYAAERSVAVKFTVEL